MERINLLLFLLYTILLAVSLFIDNEKIYLIFKVIRLILIISLGVLLFNFY